MQSADETFHNQEIALPEITGLQYRALAGRVSKQSCRKASLEQWSELTHAKFPGKHKPGEVTCPGGPQRNVALLKLFDVQEEVAKRIAHRLHDESAQMLAVIYLELADMSRDAPETMTAKINGVVHKLDEVCAQLRHLSHELRPLLLDQLGLMPGLQSLADGVRKRSGLVLQVTGSITEPLPKPTETVLYRVVQEALSNVVRHAEATVATVRLWQEEARVHCTVSDNGSGFTVPDANSAAVDGLGLVGIHERVADLKGECRILSRRGQGTELQVEIPI